MIFLLLRLFAALVLVSPAAAQPASPDTDAPQSVISQLTDPLVRMRARPLADGWVRSGEWTAIHVRLDNLGDAVDGELIVRSMGHDFTEVVHRRHVELPSGARREISLPWIGPQRGGMQRVDFVAGRRSVAEEFPVRALAPKDVLIGVIGEASGGVQSVRSASVLPVPEREPAEVNPDDPAREVRAGLIPIAALPERPQSLTAFNWLVWIDADPSALRPGQTEALRAYVASGGHLMITVTERWQQVQDSFLSELLPVTLRGSAEGTAAQELAARVGAPASGVAPHALATLRAVDSRASTTLSGTDERVGWAIGTYGLGTVSLLTVDPRVSPLGDGTQVESLWRTLLFLPPPGIDVDVLRARLPRVPLITANLGLHGGVATFQEGTGYGEQISSGEQANMDFLRDIPGVEPIPITWLLVFSLVYIALIGPVDYLVLRWLNRPVWTWVTFPIWIALFSAIALIGTTWLKGTQAVLTRFEVVDALPGTDLWRGNAMYGLWATQRARVQLRAGFPTGVAEPLEGLGLISDPTLRHDAAGSQANFQAQTWALGYVRTTWTAPAAGELVTEREGDRLRLTNNLPFDLATSGLCLPGGLLTVGPLPAGRTSEWVDAADAERTEGLYEDYSGPGSATQWALNMGCGLRPARQASAWARAVHHQAIGVSEDPIEPFELIGLDPARRNLTVLRAPLVDPSMPRPLDLIPDRP